MAHPAAKLIPELRQRLAVHGFDGPLAGESVGLVSNLLDALLSERARTARLAEDCRRQEQALWVAEQAAPPLRTEIGRLVRESARLHQELISRAEQVEALRRGESAELSRSRAEVQDLAFICATLRRTSTELEQENAGLREAASRSYELNGIVLPSGHEVRWHGRKERMEAHSPVAPLGTSRRANAATATPAKATAGDPPGLVPAAVPARLVRAAEGQLTSLLARVSVADSRVTDLEAALGEANAQIEARDAELRRMGAALAHAREAGGDADERRIEREASLAAINQLSSEVDFVNARCAELESGLKTQAASTRVVRLDEEERQRLLDAVSELRRGKQSLQEQLEDAAGVAGALAQARPGARDPFAPNA